MIPTISVSQPMSTARRRAGISLYAAVVSFAAYTCVYAFRKPFTIATFEGVSFADIPYQSILIIFQGIGYMLSKFYGIKLISELGRLGRWKAMCILIGVSWMALLGFALVPAPWGMAFMLLNGFPLGFMWGIVFSYIEGRRTTDLIGSILAVSFIFAGGFTRSVAKWLMTTFSLSETWMPFYTGLAFLLPLLLFIWLLERIPPPDAGDVQERAERVPMSGSDRRKFLSNFGVGIASVTITYLFLTIARDIRDNFMANIWIELGHGNDAAIFAKTETTTSLIILLVISLLVVIRDNILAFRVIHLVIVGGFLITGLSSLLFVTGKLPGEIWMQLVGLGLYMAYIPFNCIFFERLIAAFRIRGNVGFLIYFADAFGYLGSTAIMCLKAFLHTEFNWSWLYANGAILISAIGLFAIAGSYLYFNRKYNNTRKETYVAA